MTVWGRVWGCRTEWGQVRDVQDGMGTGWGWGLIRDVQEGEGTRLDRYGRNKDGSETYMTQ
jgi:hypothetical protein